MYRYFNYTVVPCHTRMRSRYAHGRLCKYAAAYWLYPITRALKPELIDLSWICLNQFTVNL